MKVQGQCWLTLGAVWHLKELLVVRYHSSPYAASYLSISCPPTSFHLLFFLSSPHLLPNFHASGLNQRYWLLNPTGYLELLLLHSFEGLMRGNSEDKCLLQVRKLRGERWRRRQKKHAFLLLIAVKGAFNLCSVGYKRFFFFFTSPGKRECQPSLHPLPLYPETVAFADDISKLSCRWCLWEVKLCEKRALLPMRKQMKAALVPW